ncbi:MAG: cytidine deaminase, partial [Lutimonas sp.]
MRNLDIHSHFEEFQDIDELSKNDRELFKRAVEARDRAYAPYSRFSVGAAVRLENDLIITGNN